MLFTRSLKQRLPEIPWKKTGPRAQFRTKIQMRLHIPIPCQSYSPFSKSQSNGLPVSFNNKFWSLGWLGLNTRTSTTDHNCRVDLRHDRFKIVAGFFGQQPHIQHRVGCVFVVALSHFLYTYLVSYKTCGCLEGRKEFSSQRRWKLNKQVPSRHGSERWGLHRCTRGYIFFQNCSSLYYFHACNLCLLYIQNFISHNPLGVSYFIHYDLLSIHRKCHITITYRKNILWHRDKHCFRTVPIWWQLTRNFSSTVCVYFCKSHVQM